MKRVSLTIDCREDTFKSDPAGEVINVLAGAIRRLESSDVLRSLILYDSYQNRVGEMKVENVSDADDS